MFEKRKNGQFAVLGFFRDLSSRREPLFNVGNLMGEILPQKLLTLKEWVQMAYLQILTREQSIERERNEQHIGACLYYTSCFLTLCFSFHSPFFLFDFYVTSFLSFPFASFLSHSFLLISLCYLLCLPPLFLTVHSQCPFILFAVMGFTVLPLNYFCSGVGVLPRLFTSLSAAQLSPPPRLAMPCSIPRQKSVVLLSYSLWHFHLDKGWAFSLTNSYGMHLVILAHFSLFQVICYPSRIFPPKELEREPQNRLPPSFHRQTIPSLTSDS